MQRGLCGFSLIELLMSLAILAILAAISFGAWPGLAASQAEREAEATLSKMEIALGTYYLEQGAYPQSLAELPIASDDPWGRPIHYERTPPKGYVLLCAGPDGAIAKPFDKDNVVRKK